jgi:hypothetical protein
LLVAYGKVSDLLTASENKTNQKETEFIYPKGVINIKKIAV